MAEKPVLVVMAAGMGSRYGGLKQIDPVGAHGEIIVDYSVFDARRAGFETVVFVINRKIEESFRSAVGSRLERVMDVKYVFQDLNDLPEGFSVPEGRVRPWGTAHAALAARHVVRGPFAVINSDDYYGPAGYKLIYDYLLDHPEGDSGKQEYAMVSYTLRNTVTEHGTVSRGVCSVSPEGYLESVTEYTKIAKDGEDARYTKDGESWTPLSGSTPVSMNLWGFQGSFLRDAWELFPGFLARTLKENPERGEFYLPDAVSALKDAGRVRVRVLNSGDKWYGVTYREDRPTVVSAIAGMTARGLYPEDLWGAL